MLNTLFFGVLLFSNDLLYKIYGEFYSEGYLLLILLYVSFSFRLLSATSGWLLLSLEKQYLLSKIAIFRIVLITVLILFLLHFNVFNPYLAIGFSWCLSDLVYFY